MIQKGDSLSKIAKQFNITVAQLITINNIDDADHIEAGQVLIIVPAASRSRRRPLHRRPPRRRPRPAPSTLAAVPGFGRPQPTGTVAP